MPNSPRCHAVLEELLHLLVAGDRPRREPLHERPLRGMFPHPQPVPASNLAEEVTYLLVVYLRYSIAMAHNKYQASWVREGVLVRGATRWVTL